MSSAHDDRSRVLNAFADHGHLPFRGRTAERENLLGFWRSTVEAPGLQCMMIGGEEGIGKSRLLAETSATIEREGGIVVTARLHRGIPDPLTTIIAAALRNIRSVGIPHDRIDDSLSTLCPVLRRLAALRPTLLAFDDIDAAGTDALGELARLLATLIDVPLSVLFLCRTPDERMRGIVERTLVREERLDGIGREEVEGIWSDLFNAAPSADELDALVEETMGNPLAVRAALHGALLSGGIAFEAIDGRWHTLPSPSAFRGIVARHVELIALGVTVHLDDEERSAAARLALLGETFALESARALLVDEAMLERLLTAGIITRSPRAHAALCGRFSAAPLFQFVHRLATRRLRAESRLDPLTLLSLLSERPLLYDTRLIERVLRDAAPELPAATLADVLIYVVEIAIVFDTTAEWPRGETLATLAASLVETEALGFEPEKRRDLRIRLLHSRLGLMRRSVHAEGYLPFVDELLTLTEDAENEDRAEYRIHALRRRLWHQSQQRLPIDHGLDDVGALTARFPALLLGDAYRLYLRDVANVAAGGPDAATARAIERRMNEAIAAAPDDRREETRLRMQADIAMNILWLFDSEQEYEERVATLAELERNRFVDPVVVGVWRLFFLESTGRFTDAIVRAATLVPRLRELGYVQTAVRTAIADACMRAGCGEPFAAIVDETVDIVESCPVEMRPFLATERATWLARYALLVGATDYLERVSDQAVIDALHPYALLLPLPLRERLSTQNEDLPQAPLPRDLAVALRSKRVSVKALSPLLTLLDGPILRIDDILHLRSAWRMIAEKEERGSIPPALLDALRRRTARASSWASGRSLKGIVTALNAETATFPHQEPEEEAPRRGDAKRSTSVESRVAKKVEAPHRNEALPAIEVIGRIAVTTSSGVTTPLRAGRLRALLGALIADRMLGRHLSIVELQSLIAPEEESPLRRRKGMNLAVHRLRELLGHEAIDTAEGVPSLRLDRVRVDLIDAVEAIDAAERERAKGALMRSARHLGRLFEALDGRTIFPDLYDPLFETLRDECEARTRAAVMGAVEDLLTAGDPERAEDLLRHGATGMPGDEEIVERLRRLLEARGRLADAARLDGELDEVVE